MAQGRHRYVLLYGSALAALASASPGAAQTDADKPQADKTVEEVTVVGTNISGVKPVGSEAIVVNREDAVKQGLSNVADIVRRLPQVQTGGSVGQQGGTANQGYNGSQTETINLRGLGSSATLVLIDGRRPVGSGAVATSTEANQVPLAALERIEVLPDGASALYGSDAVAGVVNFVLRKDFDGVEATARVGNQSGGTEYDGTITAGRRWEGLGGLGGGNAILTYEHQDRDAFESGKIARLRQDLRPLGGPDLRINADSASVGLSPNIVSQGFTPNTTIPAAGAFTYWGVPAGNGTGLTAANLRLNQPNLVDGSDYQDWIGKQARDQVALYLNQRLTERLELFATGNYTSRDTTSRFPASTARFGLLGTPFFIAGLPANQQVQYSTLKDNQTRIFESSGDTIDAVVGLRADLPHDWKGEGYFNYGRNQQCDSCVTGSLNSTAMAAQIASGAINPLSSTPLTAAQAASVYVDTRFESRTTLYDTVVKLNGGLFDLPAGALRMAVGGEYRVEGNANHNVSTTGASNVRTVLSTYGASAYSRHIDSLFGELYIPLLSSEMGVPLVKSLTASAAVRYDNYSDAGNSTNPRYGFTWEVNDELRFSGNWGTSFRAPSVTDANPKAVTSGTLFPGLPNYDPRITNGVLPAGIFGPFGLTNAALLLGSNPGLKPETSRNWSLSGTWKKGGLDLTATYWSIRYNNQIAFPGVLVYLAATPADVPANGGNYHGWGAFVIPIHNPATCSNADLSTADPVLRALIQNLNYDFVSSGGAFGQQSSLKNDFCRVNVVLDSRLQNVATVEQKGVDLSASYVTHLGDVALSSRLAVSRLLQDDITSGPGQTPASQLGSDLFKWRATAGVTAQWRTWDATLQARYVSALTVSGQLGVNSEALPDKTVGAHTEFDLTLGYGANLSSPLYGLKSWRAQLAVTNLFDEDPDFFATAGGAWNGRYGLPFGRTYSFQLTGRF